MKTGGRPPFFTFFLFFFIPQDQSIVFLYLSPLPFGKGLNQRVQSTPVIEVIGRAGPARLVKVEHWGAQDHSPKHHCLHASGRGNDHGGTSAHSRKSSDGFCSDPPMTSFSRSLPTFILHSTIPKAMPESVPTIGTGCTVLRGDPDPFPGAVEDHPSHGGHHGQRLRIAPGRTAVGPPIVALREAVGNRTLIYAPGA